MATVLNVRLDPAADADAVAAAISTLPGVADVQPSTSSAHQVELVPGAAEAIGIPEAKLRAIIARAAATPEEDYVDYFEAMRQIRAERATATA